MKIDRIAYQKVFPAGSYMTERISFEASIEVGEDPKAAVEELRQLAQDSHREKYPHYYADGIDPKHREEPFVQIREEAPVNEINETPEDRRWRVITDACFSIEELAKWRDKCPAYIYFPRFEQLSLSLTPSIIK